MGHRRADLADSRYRFWAVYSYVIAMEAGISTFLYARREGEAGSGMLQYSLSAKMTPASKVLGTLAFPKDSVEREELVLAAWRKSVGRRIAEHARAVRLVRTHLMVEVDDDVWRRQLFTLRVHILRNLEKVLGPKVVEDVEFRVAPPRRGMQRAETMASKAIDEADGIADPVMRGIYRAAKRKALA